MAQPAQEVGMEMERSKQARACSRGGGRTGGCGLSPRYHWCLLYGGGACTAGEWAAPGATLIKPLPEPTAAARYSTMQQAAHALAVRHIPPAIRLCSSVRARTIVHDSRGAALRLGQHNVDKVLGSRHRLHGLEVVHHGARCCRCSHEGAAADPSYVPVRGCWWCLRGWAWRAADRRRAVLESCSHLR